MTKKKSKPKSKSTIKPKAKPQAKAASAQMPKKVSKKAEVKPTPMEAGLKAVANHVEPKKKSKIDIIIELLNKPTGTSIEEMMAATGWQKHTVRGALSRELKKRGLLLTSEKPAGNTRTYTLAPKEDGQQTD